MATKKQPAAIFCCSAPQKAKQNARLCGDGLLCGFRTTAEKAQMDFLTFKNAKKAFYKMQYKY